MAAPVARPVRARGERVLVKVAPAGRVPVALGRARDAPVRDAQAEDALAAVVRVEPVAARTALTAPGRVAAGPLPAVPARVVRAGPAIRPGRGGSVARHRPTAWAIVPHVRGATTSRSKERVAGSEKAPAVRSVQAAAPAVPGPVAVPQEAAPRAVAARAVVLVMAAAERIVPPAADPATVDPAAAGREAEGRATVLHVVAGLAGQVVDPRTAPTGAVSVLPPGASSAPRRPQSSVPTRCVLEGAIVPSARNVRHRRRG